MSEKHSIHCLRKGRVEIMTILYIVTKIWLMSYILKQKSL